MLARSETLFIIVDISADEALDKQRQSLLKLAISGRMIHDENNVLTDDELVIVRDLLKESKHARLYVRNEHPRKFKVLGHV